MSHYRFFFLFMSHYRDLSYVPRRMIIFVGAYFILWIPLIFQGIYLGRVGDPLFDVSTLPIICLAAPGLINAIVWMTGDKFRSWYFNQKYFFCLALPHLKIFFSFSS